MKYPTNPKKLRAILFETYGNVADGKMSQTDWEIFSGSFNRHIRTQAASKKQKARVPYGLLLNMWACLNRLLGCRGIEALSETCMKQRRLLLELKEAFNEATV